jgi:hypothetical protein
LNGQTPNDEKSDSSKDSFYEELEQVFRSFSYIRDFNAKILERGYFQADNWEKEYTQGE